MLEIYFINSLTANETMELIKKYYSEGKIYNLNQYHFIFEENNYTQLATYDQKMSELYEKQEEILYICGIETYIIAINNTTENNVTFRGNMRDNLKKWGVYVNNSVFTVVFTDTNEGILYTGNIVKSLYIPNDEAKRIKLSFLNYTGNQEYYAAYKDLIDNIFEVCINVINKTLFPTNWPKNNDTNNPPSSTRHPDNSHKAETIGGIIGGVAALFAIIGGIICCCKCKCPKNNNNDNYYDHYSAHGGNVSVGGNSVGGNSFGGNSVGGNSFGGNSVGGNSFGGGGGGSIDANSGGA
jgi:uncharacterized membrane protein YgcG